jgi:peptide/nickel transport system permease protein
MPGDSVLPGEAERDLGDDLGSPWGSAVAAEDAITGIALPPSDVVGAPEGGEAAATGSVFSQIVRVFRENKMAVASLIFIVFMLLFCFVGPLIYKTNQTNAQEALNAIYASPPTPPGHGHPLGTDPSGFDLLGRLMYGGQASLEVGIAAALAATIFGVIYGAVSGFIAGWGDALLMRLVDVFLSIPQLFLLIVLAVIFHPSKGVLILVIAFAAWLVPARLIRGETLTLRVREYVQAVRIMGGSRSRIVLRHIIPNSIGTIVVNATFQVADAILLLAALGFLGLGLQPPETDWGTMISDGVQYANNGDWWLIYPAGVCIVLVVVAFNYVGDALRDSLEVRLQQR